MFKVKQREAMRGPVREPKLMSNKRMLDETYDLSIKPIGN